MAEIETVEELLVSSKRGAELAEAWAKKTGTLNIPNTLLNSQNIIKVVEATGLVSPFYKGGGRKSRLKKAAYEGRVGSKAYIYKDGNDPERIFDSEKDEFLLVPKNSIVFIESDLDFRLPDFIALRFNLQIQHVHRGLLLGTGPLVDPGFWGKLCIPLHNLTDQDYEIPKDEGLIWIEFTKTTLAVDEKDGARVPLEGSPSNIRGNWEIESFLDKAARQYRGVKVPIRSSIPAMFSEATAEAKRSADDAKSALEVAEKLRSINNIAMIAAAVGLCSLAFAAISFLFNLSSRNEDIANKLRDDTRGAQHAIDQHIMDVDRYAGAPIEWRASVPALRGRIEMQKREIVILNKQVDSLEKDVFLLQHPPVRSSEN